jgi:GMP synthase (glutamine-hydrolysing)
MASVTAIRFVHFEDLGTFEPVLTRRGFEIQYVDAASGEINSVASLNPDLVVLLGGPIGAYQDDDYPMLRPILAMLERRIAADLPTLGICLGAQLIARAAGARVYPGHGKEIGWAPITLTEAGRRSPLHHLSSTPVLHWHGDTFDLPRGAALLASSAMYENQAFALGANVLGLQFHPEVAEENLERWYIGHACEIAAAPSVTVPGLRQDARRYAGILASAAVNLVNRFLENVPAGDLAAAAGD